MTHKFIFMIMTILIALIGINSVASARSDITLPTSLENALTAYKEKGVNAFLPTLFGVPLTPETNSKILNETDSLRKVEGFYGGYTGLEIIDSIQISDSTRIIFFIMKYQRGPLYGVITAYKTNDAGEKITGFKIHTEIHQIIPTSILSKYMDP